MTTLESPSVAPQIILTSIGQQPELIEGAFLLAWRLAEVQSMPMGFRVALSLRAMLFTSFASPTQTQLSEQGHADIGSVRVVDLESYGSQGAFSGVVLLVGDEVTDLGSIEAQREAAVVVAVTENEDRWKAIATRFPTAIGARLIPEGPAIELSKDQEESLAWFEEHYDVLVQGHLDPSSDVVKLGTGQDRTCRYCGKTAPEVAFSNVSHAFPEQIGNKKLIDLLECDTCNSQFSKTLEDSFGKWSLPARNTGRIKGKKNKVPSYKSKDETFRVDHVGGTLHISAQQGDKRVQWDLDAKEMRVQFERQPYVPMAVFKSFVKMALAVMSESEATQCQHLKRWILEPSHTFESLPFKPLTLYSQFAPGPIRNDQVTYMLLRRKAGVIECPYVLFVIQYANHIHQIGLPMPVQDVPDGKANLQIRYMPNPWGTPPHEAQYGTIRRFQTDLSSPEVLRGETHPLTFSFDSSKNVTHETGSTGAGSEPNAPRADE